LAQVLWAFADPPGEIFVVYHNWFMIAVMALQFRQMRGAVVRCSEQLSASEQPSFTNG
jgi:hypothetical protein